LQPQLEEMARPEEALTAEQADEVQVGLTSTTTLSFGDTDNTTGLLLPAVQKVRETASRL